MYAFWKIPNSFILFQCKISFSYILPLVFKRDAILLFKIPHMYKILFHTQLSTDNLTFRMTLCDISVYFISIGNTNYNSSPAECGQSRVANIQDPFVMGGVNATEGAWPWMVNFYVLLELLFFNTPVCQFILWGRFYVSTEDRYAF